MVTKTSIWLLAAAAISAASAFPSPFSPASSLAKRFVSNFLGGAVIDVAQSGRDGEGWGPAPAIYSVAATWNVPFLDPNPGANLSDVDNRHSIAQWVGITGGRCKGHSGGALFQAGTSSELNETGITNSFAWVEWLPQAMRGLPRENMTVRPGDVVRFSLRLNTALEGDLAVENLSTSQRYKEAVTNPRPEDPLYEMCLGNGTAWYMTEWTLGKAGASPDWDREFLPVFDNVTFAGVEAVARDNDNDGGDGEPGATLDLGYRSANYWNASQEDRDGDFDGRRQVFVADPRDHGSFVLYSPEGKNWTPSRAA